MQRMLLYFALFTLLSSCIEKNSTNAAEVFKLWSFAPAPTDVRPINGRYWQSPHFTHEYVVYLHLQASAKWSEEFKKQRHLQKAIANLIVTDTPAWFRPDSTYLTFIKPGIETSGYWYNPSNNEWYIFEEQL